MKRKILACVVACATLFLGMGYAYWTDSLQIDTTATTGELSVKFVDCAVYGQYGDENRKWAIYDGIGSTRYTPFSPTMFFDRGNETDNNGLYNVLVTDEDRAAYEDRIEGYTQTSFEGGLVSPVLLDSNDYDNAYGDGTMSSDSIAITVTDIYPGYAQMFRTDILNIGTLAARLADIKVNMTNANDDMDDMIGVSLKVLTENNASIKVLSTNDPDKFFTIGGVDFVKLSALDDLAISDGSGDDLLYIYPGANTMDAIFGIAMDPDYDGAYTTGHVGLDPASDSRDVRTQGKTGKFEIEFLWDQFNTSAQQ